MQDNAAPAGAAPAGPGAGEATDVLCSTTFGPKAFVEAWATLLRQHGLVVQIHPYAVTDLSRVRMAIVFDPPPGLLGSCCNLEAIHSMGAGISPSMLREEVCPSHVPLLRVVDGMMAQRMATFCFWAVVNCQRKCDAYLAAQLAASWEQGKAVESYRQRDNGELRVGVMGAGNLGGATIRLLGAAGYPVSCWTRSPRQEVPGATRCYYGRQQLREFASQADVVVNLVPLTKETRGILNAEFFSWLPRGTCLVNVSRGQHVVDADLLAALDDGQLALAVLDVFHEEPLPPESPLWHHPKIRVFPHVSGITHLPSAAEQIARMHKLLMAGQPLPPEVVVDRERGY